MIASERIKMDPHKVIVGDLVLAEEKELENPDVGESG